MTDRKIKAVLPSTKKIKLSSSSDDSKRLKNASSKDNDETASSGKNVLSTPNSSRSPEETVFSIDHILESILGKCDRQTLLTSRLISRRWAIYGSKELQNIVDILFHKSPFGPGEQRPRQFSTNRKRTLNDLIKVMNNSPEFPCTSFHFRDQLEGRTRQSSAQSFFDAHGAAIRKIKFQYLFIDNLKNILLCQAPNLQQLYLDGSVDVEYTHSTKRRPDLETDEQQSERERVQESLFDVTTLKPQPILKNLKTLRCRVSLGVPEILLQQILECSPHLVDVTLPSEYIHLLVQPTNRVHLVKKLIIDINSSNIESYELFAHYLQDNENFAVRELYYVTGENYDDEGDEELYGRVANVMRKILEASSATCRKLVWLEEVVKLQMPRMPRVTHLTINYFLQLDDDEDANDLENIVPVHSLRDCVSLGETFPNLKSLEIRSSTDMGIRPIANIFNDIDPLPAANVKTVTMRLWYPRRKVVRNFQKMFPNASFKKKVANFSYDDGNSDSESGYDEESDSEESAGDESGEDENGDGESGDDENGEDENGKDKNGDDENDEQENDDTKYRL